jgi:hypothetical protein
VLGRPPPSFARRRRKKADGDYNVDPLVLRDDTVYFSSNQYHGNHFLTDEAASAGYSNKNMRPDRSFLEKGIGTLLQQDRSSLIEDSEQTLLLALVQVPSVRTVLKNSIDARNLLHSNVQILWSNPAREWLFNILTNESNRIPTEARLPDQLREFLVQLEYPERAFVAANSTGQIDGLGSSVFHK